MEPAQGTLELFLWKQCLRWSCVQKVDEALLGDHLWKGRMPAALGRGRNSLCWHFHGNLAAGMALQRCFEWGTLCSFIYQSWLLPGGWDLGQSDLVLRKQIQKEVSAGDCVPASFQGAGGESLSVKVNPLCPPSLPQSCFPLLSLRLYLSVKCSQVRPHQALLFR